MGETTYTGWAADAPAGGPEGHGGDEEAVPQARAEARPGSNRHPAVLRAQAAVAVALTLCAGYVGSALRADGSRRSVPLRVAAADGGDVAVLAGLWAPRVTVARSTPAEPAGVVVAVAPQDETVLWAAPPLVVSTGDQWEFWGPRVRYCESGGDYNSENSASTASGAYQFLDSTWAPWAARYGVARARLATPSQQEQAAHELYLLDGLAPWTASQPCWSHLGPGPIPTPPPGQTVIGPPTHAQPPTPAEAASVSGTQPDPWAQPAPAGSDATWAAPATTSPPTTAVTATTSVATTTTSPPTTTASTTAPASAARQ